MNSLTRQLGRIALNSSSRTAPSACLATRPSLLSSAPRFAVPSTSPLAARSYATESSHLGNLSPAPGSSHKVQLLPPAWISPKRTRKLTHLFGAHSGNVLAEELVLVGVERLEGVTRVRVLAQAMASQRCTLREVRLPSPAPTPSVASRTRELQLSIHLHLYTAVAPPRAIRRQ
jgi:hypothetical protein